MQLKQLVKFLSEALYIGKNKILLHLKHRLSTEIGFFSVGMILLFIKEYEDIICIYSILILIFIDIVYQIISIKR